MQLALRQLTQWRFRERLIRLVWGGARVLAIAGTVLAFACFIDWLIDRYSGSPGWRNFFRDSWFFSSLDPLGIGETPIWVRFLLSVLQLGLAAALVQYFLIRPLEETPRVDDLATEAEKAFPAFDHRLVTAIQLNRPAADTRGMSRVLIAEVTREAGEIAERHNFLSLVDYKRIEKAIVVLAPVLVLWGLFFFVRPALVTALVERQMMPWANIPIPRSIQLENATAGIFPMGGEVPIRFKVRGKYSKEMVGAIRVIPEGQPEEFYDLVYEKDDEAEEGAAYFTISVFDRPALPASSRNFQFMARLGDGRTTEPAQVTFEAPPQLDLSPGSQPLNATIVLPLYLGLDPNGKRFERGGDAARRGEVIDALPQSTVKLDARFNKPIAAGKAVLIPIERQGVGERDLAAVQPVRVDDGRREATFVFNTTPRMIAYRLELVDNLGFRNPTQIRRNVRMWDDRPPVVEFRPETTRDPNIYDPLFGSGDPKKYNPKVDEWEMPLTLNGVIQVIYAARSDAGVRSVNLRYRVIPKGVQYDAYPEEYRRIQHPANDPNLLVYDRLPLVRFDGKYDMKKLEPFVPSSGLFELIDRVRCSAQGHIGPFDTDLGLFRYSLRGLTQEERNRVNVQFYPLPSDDPQNVPAELAAFGRYNFEVAGLLKKIPERQPDGTVTIRTANIEIGDTVELYVEAFDKVAATDGKGNPLVDKNGNFIPDPTRRAGYTREARRKIVVTEAEAELAMRQRDESRRKLQDKLKELADDQAEVFRPKKK
ncbi:MAG TPA: hypothetical protein VLM40_19540 [Gemmata sp.]|nr:hypothetical protein [Gemmata sp.]